MHESELKYVSQLHPGDVLDGNYGLMQRLGSGSLGELWKARHVRSKDEVAIRLLRHDGSGVSPRLGEEYDVVSALRHPNIVRVIARDQGESGLRYLVMELLEGEDLRALLERARKNEDPASRALAVASCYEHIEQLVSGLSHAHERQLVHGDLKPGNVFITREGQVEIADFGLARELGAQLELTKTGTGRLGSAPYMAPEQRLGKSEVDQRADIYSLSAIICEMLTGVAFDENVTEGELDRAKVEVNLTRASLSIPADITQAVLRGLAAEPELRQASAEALLEPFRRFAPEGAAARRLAPGELNGVTRQDAAPAEREWEWPAETAAKSPARVVESRPSARSDQRAARSPVAGLRQPVRRAPWLWRGALALLMIGISVTLIASW